MSTVDLTNSFWQVPLHRDLRKYIAFLHGGHCYEFLRVPFGTKTSRAALMRAMDGVLDRLNFVIDSVDDLLIVSEDEKEHLRHLEISFERITQHEMTINLKECKFFRKEVRFLGHMLSVQGLKSDPEKVSAIHQFSRPKTVKQLRWFRELISFCSRFTDRYAEETRPSLRLLTEEKK